MLDNVIIGHKIPKEEIDKLQAEMIDFASKTILKAGEDYNSPNVKEFDFGFIYYMEGQLLAMFKIITDKKTIYFAKQLGTTTRLDDEKGAEHYAQLVEMMKHVNGRHVNVDWKATGVDV